MRLYHPGSFRLLFWLGALPVLAGCIAPKVAQEQIKVIITAGRETVSVNVPPGSTVETALAAAGLVLGQLDRTEPPSYTVLNQETQVSLIRVQEEFIVEQVTIPFEYQVVQNESLPVGEEYWAQLGQNGIQEDTIRKVMENGKEVTSATVKTVIVKPPVAQIKMVGVQKPFTPFEIPGSLVYLVEGNAWVMEGTTGNRRQFVSTGDLDGRVFSLSPDGEWLLFTRRSEQDDQINSLWVASLQEDTDQLVDLQVNNVLHFADWKPDAVRTVAYSTVEPRLAAPGWQANNDLGLVSFTSSGEVKTLPPVLDTNSGGLYGWWGTTYAWMPDGAGLVYARPDEIGLLELDSGDLSQLLEVTPLQTFGDWAWVPQVAWGLDGKFIYTVAHPPPPESQQFDLVAIPGDHAGNAAPSSELTPTQKIASQTVASQVGMFAYPVPSPLEERSSGEAAYEIAYLQAIFPSQSETSRYRLMIMDRDGSNRKALFPAEGLSGLEPQRVVWSPGHFQEQDQRAIAVNYQNNLWLVNTSTGIAWQVTGDGLTTRLDWK
jgi:hypothetical protein